MFINVDGKPYMSQYDALIASSNPDHWRWIDLKLMQGKTLSVKIEGPNAAGIELVKTSDTIPGKYPVYQEPGRPKVHFSPIRGWLNDPSGMIYYQGTWSFCYANTRFNNVMAGPNNAWGHATSSDLLHWEEQPLFLTPIRGECSFWTGGAAVDVANTSGLSRPGKPAIIFSANNGSDAPNAFTQCVFVSTDGGMTAIREPGDDVQAAAQGGFPPRRRHARPHDPLVGPREEVGDGGLQPAAGRQERLLLLRVQGPQELDGDERARRHRGVPQPVPLPVDGNQADMRWVIWGSGTEYRIGKFNGRAFVPTTTADSARITGHFSASQVFANAPGGRIVQIGWAHVLRL